MAFPTSPIDGQIYNGYIYDSVAQAWMNYDIPYGVDEEHPASSIQSIINTYGDMTLYNGKYYIQADNDNEPSPLYSNMEDHGGGWQLAAKMDGSNTTFEYSSLHWTTSTTLNTDSINMDLYEAKFENFNSTPITEVMLKVQNKAGGDFTTVVIPKVADSLLSVFASNTYQPTNLGTTGWSNLFPSITNTQIESSYLEGFNVNTQLHSRTRLGIIGDEAPMGDPDSAIGFGNNDEHPWGAYPPVGGGIANGTIEYFGYIFIR